jgi:hypothetical protein
MCLTEQSKGGNTGDISVGMITICPSTGDVVWDDFDGKAALPSEKISALGVSCRYVDED